LAIFLQCLQVFGLQAHLQITYAGAGAPVSLLLEEGGVITQCEVHTLENTNPIDFDFRAAPITSRAVIKSQFLKNSFAELDVPGATEVLVGMYPRAPFLQMSTKGNSSSCQIDFPMEKDADVFTEFDCKEESVHRYPLSLIRPCVKALAKSDHTNLRMNQEGMLSMQHVIPASDGHTNWVEFLICAQEETEETQ